MKILVVDDEKLLVKGIKFNLENEGYQVECCYDGESAVQLARAGGYGLIILDRMMPGLDGLEACQQIREFSTVPIIMLTARSEDSDKLLGFESGADDYITRPGEAQREEGRRGSRAHGQGIRPSRALHAQPGQGVQPGQHARHHLGLLLSVLRAQFGLARPTPAGKG